MKFQKLVWLYLALAFSVYYYPDDQVFSDILIRIIRIFLYLTQFLANHFTQKLAFLAIFGLILRYIHTFIFIGELLILI